MECPFCAETVDPDTAVCPHCDSALGTGGHARTGKLALAQAPSQVVPPEAQQQPYPPQQPVQAQQHMPSGHGILAGQGIYCKHCGTQLAFNAIMCVRCGAATDNFADAAGKGAKSRTSYVLLGFFLGGLGIHNFYAGYTGKGVAQLLITLLTLGFGAVIVWPWVIVEMFTVTQDATGQPFC